MVRPRTLIALAGTSLLFALGLGFPGAVSASTGFDTRVNVGSPPTPFAQNKQNEPAVAVDANHPNVVVAGANDEIDVEACNAGVDTTCPFTPGVGTSGVYFSFNSGTTWTQPTYTGFSARGCLGAPDPDTTPCTPNPAGPIGTLPHYFENGLVSDGDPGVAFGPAPDASGNFSWSNGSRLYYSNLTASFPGAATFRGAEAIAVSRTDDVAAAAAGNASAWMNPVIISKQSSTTFSDKEQIWADNASSSPFFGNVYVCLASFRSLSHGNAAPQPLVVAVSSDGGSTWTTHQVTPASNNPFNMKQGFGRSGCTVRTDSHGVVYVFANQFAVGQPGNGAHIMLKSFNGGKTFTPQRRIFGATDTCFLVQFDGTSFRCVEDGVGGARDDLSSAPSVSIANGAPTGAGATNEIVDTWVDGRDGPGTVHVFVSHSTNGGGTWSAPQDVAQGSDRGYYSAPALSPDGHDLYLVYNAFTTPLRSDTTSPRGLVGVVLHADVNTSTGAVSNWTVLNRGTVGDPRGSSQNNQFLEFLGDYVYAAATNDFGVAVWNDTRAAADCPAEDAWRAMAQSTLSIAGRPAPEQQCPATFGNSDIFGGTYSDPNSP
jgi:hypothetical protein